MHLDSCGNVLFLERARKLGLGAPGQHGGLLPAASPGSVTGGARAARRRATLRPARCVLTPRCSIQMGRREQSRPLAGPHAPRVSLKTKRAGTRAPEGAPGSGGRKVRGLPARQFVLQKSMGVVRPHEASRKGNLARHGQGTTRRVIHHPRGRDDERTSGGGKATARRKAREGSSSREGAPDRESRRAFTGRRQKRSWLGSRGSSANAERRLGSPRGSRDLEWVERQEHPEVDSSSRGQEEMPPPSILRSTPARSVS